MNVKSPASQRFLSVVTSFVLLTSGAQAATPWLPIPGAGYGALSYVYQTADEIFAGDTRADLPTDLEQHTASLYLEYGVTDALALDARIGYASTSFLQDPVLSPSDSLDGLTDTNLGLRWRLVDEATSDWPTVTLRIAGNIRGDYETGALNAIGDGASGAEFSLIVGKAFENGLSLYAEGGYRVRDDPVPDEQFYNVGAAYAFAPRWTGSVSLRFVDALSGIDIGSPGFTPARFPETEEDFNIVDVGLGYQLTESVRVAAGYGTVFDGRNTAIQDIASFSVRFAF